MSSKVTARNITVEYPLCSLQLFKKVKCTLVQALRLCTGCTAHRGSRGIALPFLDHGTRRGWGVSVTPRPLFTPGKDPVPIVQEAGWSPGPVWTGAENLAPTGIRSPDPLARSQSLYRLRCPTHHESLFRLYFQQKPTLENTVRYTYSNSGITPGKEPVPIVQEGGWAPELVWTGAENLAPHRDLIPGPSSP